MPRTRKTIEAAERTKEKADKVLKGRELLGPMSPRTRKPRAKKFGRAVSSMAAERYVRQVDEMIDSGEYNMSPRHWVALYCWLHEAVYGVTCVEEVRSQWGTAASRAQTMLTEEFEDDEDEFMAYMKWIAQDEERVENWRRTNHKQGRRLQWRDFFIYKTKLSDYRLARLRTKGTA